MTRDAIVRMFDAREDAIARRDIAFLVSQHAEDCEQISPLAGGIVRGREAIGKLYEAWFNGFPDLVWVNDEPLIDGDRITQMTTQTGTDTGGFMGLPATGKPFRVPVVWLFTVRDGEFTHVRPIYDFTGLLVQIGLLKAKPA
jgi:predicted ester cyclase